MGTGPILNESSLSDSMRDIQEYDEDVHSNGSETDKATFSPKQDKLPSKEVYLDKYPLID